MSKTFKKIASVALPVGGAIFGGPLGGAIGGALGGAVGGGGLKGAGLGAGLGYLGGGGGFGSVASAPLAAGAAGPTTAGSGILGALTSGGGPLAGAVRSGVSGLSNIGTTLSTGGNTLSRALGLARPEAGGGLGGGSLGNILSNVYGGIQGSGAYKDIARAQTGGIQRGLEGLSPFLTTGQAASGRLGALLGLDPSINQEEVLEQLRGTPGYQFRLGEGQQALQRSLGARGKVFSGEALKSAQEYGQGLADQTYNDYLRNLQQQSLAGQQAAGTAAGMYGAMGDVQAASRLGRQNLLNRSLANILTPQGV